MLEAVSCAFRQHGHAGYRRSEKLPEQTWNGLRHAANPFQALSGSFGRSPALSGAVTLPEMARNCLKQGPHPFGGL
eukprot:2305321-Alexandrium_andersonii.AAC.1